MTGASKDDCAQARVDMFESGLFGQGDAFWRWIETEAAKPYIAAFAGDRRAPEPGEFFAIDLVAADLLDPDHLTQLAQQIEADHA